MESRSTLPEITARFAAYQPLFGLEVHTPRLALRMPTDPELLQLLQVIGDGIHDPAFMPFRIGWTDVPSPQRERESLAYWWRCRAEWSPAAWSWCGAVHVGDQIVGVQDLAAQDFSALREVSSGSFIGLEHQGHGLGKEMRAAVLHLAFAGLGATRAYSGYIEGNTASKRVSEALGYEPNGYETVIVRGHAVREIRLVLERSVWESTRRDDISIEGLENCIELFGASAG
jgi:RimJ/RimL family protein N-acetyltransferase